MSSSRFFALLSVVALLCSACSERPSLVLSKKEMTSLLMDMYKAEGVMTIERSRYYNDSLKKVVAQSVYEAHGVTEEEVDSSFAWYGKHIDEYLKIHEDVIASLKREMAENTGIEIVYTDGDSIDLWTDVRQYRITPQSVSGKFAFTLKIDENTKPGDNYQLNFKTVSPFQDAQLDVFAMLFAEYADGMQELKYNTSERDGWTRVRFVCDTMRAIEDLYGFIEIEETPALGLYVDSISLVRTRNQPSTYSLRYGQRKISSGVSQEE